MTRKRLLIVTTAAIAALLACLSPADAGVGWWNKAWPCRRAVRVPDFRSRDHGTNLAWCTFSAGDELSPGGRGIRVTDRGGRLVAHAVIYAEPGRRCEVVFETGGPGTYFIYYGNKAAGPGAKKLKLNRGLTLETRSRPPGPCNSWRQYQKLLRESKTVYGRGLRTHIYDGFNPYGPSDNYLSIYRGYIYCEQSGTYRFATNSDESSFVFVNGRKVVEWAGPHGPGGAHGQHNGAVELARGFHKIEYYHEDGGGGQACVLGWWRPGDRQVSLVPPAAFSSFVRARTSPCEKLGSPAACDFVFQYRSDLKLPSNIYCEVAFFDRTEPAGALSKWQWEFGDGTRSTRQNPVHVYLAPGFYRVTLTVTGPGATRDSTCRTVYAGQLFINAPERRRAERYAQTAKNYNWEKLDLKNLLGARALFKFVDDPASQVVICKTLASRGNKLRPRDRYKVLLTLGDLLRKELKDADAALKAYQQIINESISKKRTLMGKIGVADVHFQLKKNYDKALKMYQEVVENYRDVSLAYCRLAQIRIGDIRREQGDYAKAREAYKKSTRMKHSVSHVDEALKRGELAMTIESYLRRNEHRAALKKLDLWDWEYPEDKLSGYSSILRAKANYGLEKFGDVIEDLTALIKVNSGEAGGNRSNYLAEAKYIIAYALMRQEKYEPAIKMMQRVINEHPESDLLDKAKKVITRCRKQLGK